MTELSPPSDFLRSLPPYGRERDALLLDCIATGRLTAPRWYRLRMGRVELEVSCDYLAFDGQRCPMSAPVAQAAVDSLDALLPTPAIVDAIEQAPGALVTWLPTRAPSGAKQLSAAWFDDVERETVEILRGYRGWEEALLAGHRKDIVLIPEMRAGRVYIYGARWIHGPRVEPKPHGAHEARYADYSHGARAVRRRCWLDGRERALDLVLADGLCGGPVARSRYPAEPAAGAATETSSAWTPATAGQPLRRGQSGPLVAELQRRLSASGYGIGDDGLFGPQTEAAVRKLQAEKKLLVDGVVGPLTRAALGWAEDGEDPLPVVPPVMSEAQIWATYGRIKWIAAPTAAEPRAVKVTNGWNAGRIVSVVIPQLARVKGAPVGNHVLCHKLFAPRLLSAFADVEREGKLGLIRTWDGLLSQRTMTGAPNKLSRHAYGIGFDINAAWNPFHGPAARGEGTVLPLVPIFLRHGITWLGDHDPMHFEAMV